MHFRFCRDSGGPVAVVQDTDIQIDGMGDVPVFRGRLNGSDDDGNKYY